MPSIQEYRGIRGLVAAEVTTDTTEAFECDVTGMGSGNAWGDAMTYSVNCVRTMPKADGSYVLIACNLKQSEAHVLQIWAWVNGPQSAPTCIGRYAYDAVANATDHRRYGDRFDVKGTWEDGELWFPSMQADDHGKTIVFKTFEGVDNANRPSAYHRMEPILHSILAMTRCSLHVTVMQSSLSLMEQHMQQVG